MSGQLKVVEGENLTVVGKFFSSNLRIATLVKKPGSMMY